MKLNYAALIFMAVGLASQAVAETPALEDVRRAERQNSAALEALAARLDLAEWRLQQLQSLKRDGHATWLEVTCAEVYVKQLRAERRAAHEFAEFVADLREAVWQCAESDHAIAPSDGETVVMFHLPGSVRLVSWLDISQLPADEAKKQLAWRRQLVDGDVAAAARLLTDAEVQAAQNQDFVTRLQTVQDRGGSPTELRRAEMQLAAAQAEVELARVVHQNLQSEQQQLAELEESFAAQPAASIQAAALINTNAASAPFVSHRDRGDLHEATARLAATEAEAAGRLRAAELLLRRQTLRLDGIKRLREQGFASPVEVETASKQHAAAQQLVEQTQSHRALLGHAAREFTTLNVADSETPADTNIGELPAAFWQHAAAVRHLLDLRQSRVEASARQAAVGAEHAMHEALLEKLKRIGNDSAGGRRELEFAELDVQFDRAQIQAAAERETALRLEERRFALQFAAQLDSGRRNIAAFVEPRDVEIVTVAIAPRRKSPVDTELVPSAYWYDVVNTLRSFAGKPLVSERELRTFPPRNSANSRSALTSADWAWPALATVGSNFGAWLFLPTETLAVGGPSVLDGRVTATYKQSPFDAATILYANPAFADLLGRLPSVDDAPSVFSGIGIGPSGCDGPIHWYRNGIRWTLGIQRFYYDFPGVYVPRLRANGYGGPWYIPGSTTNFDRAYNLPWDWRQY